MSRRRLKVRNDETPSSSSEASKNEYVAFSGLLGTSWKLHQTSLLLDPNELKAKIRRFGSLLKQEGKKDKCYTVTFTTCREIRRNDSLPPALLVNVSQSDESIYKGYFVNWCEVPQPIEHFENLPLLLVRAKASAVRLVHSVLVKAFDFDIMPIRLNARHLAALFAIFVWSSDEDDVRMAKLKYTMPGQPDTNQINLSVRVKELRIIFNLYNTSDLEEHEETDRVFYEKVLLHFRRAHHLDLTRANFRQVSLPDGFASDTGQIRLNNEDALNRVLVAVDAFFPQQDPTSPPPSYPSDSGWS